MLKVMDDLQGFRAERNREWERARDYWLSQPLRHVVDIGDAIADHAMRILDASPDQTVVDCACGSGWLLDALRKRGFDGRYVGVDQDPVFLDHVRQRATGDGTVDLVQTDLEDEPTDHDIAAPLVVSAFTLIELGDLDAAARNLRSFMAPGGKLIIATIDKTYLMLALADGDWGRLTEIFREYTQLQGTKYFFQSIDLGTGASNQLRYASVLYSTQDLTDAFAKVGLELTGYTEIPATDRPIPKIYEVLEFGEP